MQTQQMPGREPVSSGIDCRQTTSPSIDRVASLPRSPCSQPQQHRTVHTGTAAAVQRRRVQRRLTLVRIDLRLPPLPAECAPAGYALTGDQRRCHP